MPAAPRGLARCRWRERYHWPPAWPPITVAAGDLWPGGDRRAAGQACHTEGKTNEWKSAALRAYQRRTKQADSLIAGAYLAGTNTRRVRRALSAVFGGAG